MSSLANFYLTQSGALRKNVKLFTLGNEQQPPPYPTYDQLYQLFSLFIELVNKENRTLEQSLRKEGAAVTLEMRGIKRGAKVVQMEYTFQDMSAATAFTAYFTTRKQSESAEPLAD